MLKRVAAGSSLLLRTGMSAVGPPGVETGSWPTRWQSVMSMFAGTYTYHYAHTSMYMSVRLSLSVIRAPVSAKLLIIIHFHV